MLFSAMPYFWVALLLVYVFAQRLHAFPLSGGYNPALVPGWHAAFVATAVRHAILPALTIVISSVGRLDARHAQHDGLHAGRGLRGRRAGQGPAPRTV